MELQYRLETIPLALGHRIHFVKKDCTGNNINYLCPSTLACVAVVSVSFKHERRARAFSKRAGKERKRLPLSPGILPNAVHQRTGGNDVLPSVNRLSIKLIDQNDIRFPFIKDKNMAEAENSFECPFDFEFALLWKRLNFFRGEIR